MRGQGGCEESSRGWEKCRCRCRKEVSYESTNAKIEENFTKIYRTHDARINALIDGGAIAIRDLVKKLNSVAGIKTV